MGKPKSEPKKEEVAEVKVDRKGEKGGGFNPVDSAIAGYILRVARTGLRKLVLDPLKKLHPNLWFRLAWVYLEAPAKFRESFELGLRGTGAVADNFIDGLPFPGIFKQVAEDVIADAPNELANYFNDQKGKMVWPEGFDPKIEISMEDMELFKKDFIRFFQRQVEKRFQWVTRQLDLLAPFRGPSHARFVKTLLGLGSKAIRRFDEFAKANIQSEEDWTSFKTILQYMDEPEELEAFLSQPLGRQTTLYKAFLMIRKKEAIPYLLKLAKDNWVKFELVVNRIFAGTADLLEFSIGGLATHYSVREIEIAVAKRRRENQPVPDAPWWKKWPAIGGMSTLVLLVATLVLMQVSSCVRSKAEENVRREMTAKAVVDSARRESVWRDSLMVERQRASEFLRGREQTVIDSLAILNAPASKGR